MNTLALTKTLTVLSDMSVAFLTILALSLMFASGCALMDVPKHLVGGLQRSATVAPEPSQADIEVAQRDRELSEFRTVLDRMVESGELTWDAADLKYLQEKARLDNQLAQLEQQRDLAARNRQQQFLNGNRGTNCTTNGLGYMSCF